MFVNAAMCAIYVLGCAGLHMTLRLINFAHGDIYMLGALVVSSVSGIPELGLD